MANWTPMNDLDQAEANCIACRLGKGGPLDLAADYHPFSFT